MPMKGVTVENPKLILNVFECDKNIEILHTLLNNLEVFETARVTLTWMTKEQILKINQESGDAKPRQVFVLPLFDGSKLYHHLSELGYTVLGPHAISYCAMHEEPLPPHELYSMAFNNTSVSFVGFDDKQLEQASRRIKLMGGNVEPNFNISTDILISKTCETTQEFKVACAWKTPICDVSLIDAMWSKPTDHVSKFVSSAINEFSLKLLSGCVITFAEIESNERKQLEELISQNGGVYTEDLDKDKCTHLIAGQVNSDKFKLALEWNLNIVSANWVYESLKCDVRLPEKFYYPRDLSDIMNTMTLG